MPSFSSHRVSAFQSLKFLPPTSGVNALDLLPPSDTFLGYPVCDKLKELNENIHRWKVESASPDETPLGFFSDNEDECDEEEIVTFEDDSVSSYGNDTKLPVSRYHKFGEGRYSPEYSEGDITWKLVTIIKQPGTNMLGQKVKLKGDLLVSSTPETDTQDVYVFKKKQSETGGCEKWHYTQKINSDKIFNWSNLSKNPGITMNDIENNLDLPWNWNFVTLNPNLNIEFGYLLIMQS